MIFVLCYYPMKNIPLLIGTIVGTLVLIVAVAFMFSGDSQTAENGLVEADPAVILGDARHAKMEGEASQAEMVENGEDAMDQDQANSTDTASLDESGTSQNQEIINIVEFSDFQCPACKAAAPLGASLVQAYPGKVQLVFRHFPLDSIHPNAKSAGIAAEAVAAIDETKFWPMHDLLFETQSDWSNIRSTDELNDTFATYAEQLDIDRNEFLEKIEDNSVIELVSTDSNTAIQLGLNSTPTFFVNGIKVSAPQLQATVESLIGNNE